ncbi:MAG: hypothetical protein HYX84_05730 [Chloroflexi bacterium]|nr:hypothetical protein [Chloroflexota bacterium]
MCWNCGCLMPDDDMGNKDNITTATLLKAGKAAGNKNLQELVKNFVLTYETRVKGTPEDTKPIK